MEIKNVVYSHDKKVNHVNNVSLRIDPGKITTIIGPNGCGKSTLLGVMSNHFVPQQGDMMLDGKNIITYKPKELARKIAVVHQQNSAPADMTVERLVRYGRLPYKSMFKTDKAKDDAAVAWALEETSLIDDKHRTIDALSGGQRQRVWIAMSLAQQTPYLFLDEPTTYLDMYYQYELLELIKRLNQEHGLTIVMVLHDINQAIRYSDAIVAMKAGKMLIKGDPKETITNKLIHEIYGVDVLVKEDKEAGIYTVPVGI